MARRPSMGRQKIEIKRISCEASRQVTFAKRRVGLFKKASELCTLCGAETAIVVFSPSGKKIFSFGHPGVESVIERYLIENNLQPEASETALPLVDAHRDARVHELNKHYNEVLNQLETEKKRAEKLQREAMELARQGRPWWEAPIEDMEMLELQQLEMSMEDLKEKMVKRADELMATAALSFPFLPINSMEVMDRNVAAPNPNNASSSVIPYGNYYGLDFGRGPF